MSLLDKENIILGDVTKNTLFSIKEKLSMFEEASIKLVMDSETSLVDIGKFKEDMEGFNTGLEQRPLLIRRQATNDCEDKEEQINKHLTHQKVENGRMNKELDHLKEEHTSLYATVHACQKKLKELENRIGLTLALGKTL